MGLIKNLIIKRLLKPDIIYPSRVFLGKGNSFAKNTTIYADGESIKIGDRCMFEIGSYLRLWGGSIEIGNDFFLGPYSVIYGHGGVKIGNNVIIASHVTIIPANHIYQNKNINIQEQGITKKGIVIEDNVWIASGAVLLDGIKIKKHSIIAAGAVVRNDVEAFSVVGGVPAKKLKEI